MTAPLIDHRDWRAFLAHRLGRIDLHTVTRRQAARHALARLWSTR